MVKKIVIACTLILLLSVVFFTATSSQVNSSQAQEVVEIEIHHCTTCGFRAKAEDVAEKLYAEFGVEATLLIGDIGSFDVYVNDELIFSRAETGRFPTSEELVQLIHEKYK